ncbi:MAG: prolipoprotein diacylglyceryl transferase [Parcubacteria group bacterium]|jgi:phosphatidylglycerol:prolipoprotein diacylglycerol transferase
MLNFYQHLPSYIDPIAFSLGNFEIRWYALMYLAAFAIVYFLLMYRIEKQEFFGELQTTNHKPQTLILDFLLYAIVGLLIGARLGYVLFYNLPYYLAHPLEAFLPIQVTGYGLRVTGFYGMSYFGGVIGIIPAGIIFCKKYKINFWHLADFVAPAIPAGYFFGRLGNFLNGELVGRATAKPWGMYFADGILRHPSQLYEAFFEGLVLFVILWILRNPKTSDVQQVKQTSDIRCPNGSLLLPYLFLYAFFRFFIEFLREPDPQVGLLFSWLTLSQFFSLLVMLLALLWVFLSRRRSY